MIKAVFFDIDGTLVSFKTHRVPDSTNIPYEPGHFAIEIKYKFSYFYNIRLYFQYILPPGNLEPNARRIRLVSRFLTLPLCPTIIRLKLSI